MYIASGSRDTTPQEEVEKLQRLIEETGSKAVKFKVGGRMSNNCGRKSNNLDSLTVSLC
jgi:L-alanine-DL-glutamate epimerase-like enolase superfamily enzyme